MRSKAKKAKRAEGWSRGGYCRICVRPIEAWQPGGKNPRHVEDKAPLCKGE